MLYFRVKVAEVAASIFSTGYAQVFKLYGVAACVIPALILYIVIDRSQLLRHLYPILFP